MKKFFGILLAIMLMTGVFAISGCSSGGETEITAISRESGSGTRSAFHELLGLDEIDLQEDLVCDKTNNVITAIANNKYAIGYISLGSLNNTVKPLSIDGVPATTGNIINNTYAISRPFIVVYKTSTALTQVAADFKVFLESSQAQEIITEKGFVSTVTNAASYTGAIVSGKLNLSGSTSVSPLMLSLAAEYIKLSNKVNENDITMSQTGSSAGISAAMGGTCDFGMSSRELKSNEKAVLTEMQLCKDGIAVIVNKENILTNITKANLLKIYKGEISKFSEII